MKLSDYEFLPGVVLTADDPKKIGRIKVAVPTWFDTNVMDLESLPWVYPLCMGGYQTFSKMEKDRTVWVFHNKENYLEYWYLPMFHMIGQTKQKIASYDNSEVLISRALGNNKENVIVSYNDHEGLLLRVGDTAIKIGTDKTINISNGEAQISIKGGNVCFGGEGSLYSSVLGEKLKDLLMGISSSFKSLNEKAITDPHTTILGPLFLEAANQINDASSGILGETVKFSDKKSS